MTEKIQSLLAGRWRDASGPAYTTEYPHDGSTVAQLNAATVADVDEAVHAAEKARQQPAWAKLMPHERAGILYRMANCIREKSEALAQLQRLDNGKPIKECRALVASAAGTFQFFGAAAETWEDAITPSRGDFLTMSVHEPLGGGQRHHALEFTDCQRSAKNGACTGCRLCDCHQACRNYTANGH